jgi:hypothetical protein
MRESKYLLESSESPLPFWYATLSQISDRTAPNFNFLTPARSQGRIDVVIGFSQFGGYVVGLSVTTHYGASKCYAPTHNLIIIIESSLQWFLVVIMLPRKILNQIVFWRISPPFNLRLRIVNPA